MRQEGKCDVRNQEVETHFQNKEKEKHIRVE